MLNPDAKIAKLHWILWNAYYEERWLLMEEIIHYTEMSSFNQRIQTMRKAGIKIENKTEGGKSFYRLLTDPQTINWKDYKAVIPRQRIRRGRRVEKVETQGTLL
jgi:hypothetical protein